MDDGSIVIKSVHIDNRAGAFYVQSSDCTPGGLLYQGTWIKKMAEDLPDADLGRAVREAMAASRAEPWPGGPALRDEVARRRKDLFRVAGVRSERQYQTGLSAVRIDDDPGANQYQLTKFINYHPNEAMVASETEHLIPVASPDNVLGSTIRGLLLDESG